MCVCLCIAVELDNCIACNSGSQSVVFVGRRFEESSMCALERDAYFIVCTWSMYTLLSTTMFIMF